jgi:hypothetical protein
VHKRILCLVALSACAATAAAQSTDYRERWSALTVAAYVRGDAQSIELIDAFFGVSSPELDGSGIDRRDFDDLSDAGWQTLIEARNTEALRRIDELNCGKLATAKLCIILNDNPAASASFIAEQKAAARELAVERKLARYREVYASLSPADRAVVDAFNKIAFGRHEPEISREYRERLATIAKEFPGDFIADVRAECALEREDDGLLFRPQSEMQRWESISQIEQCEATKRYARQLALVCPENIDPQDADESCDALLNPEKTPLP